MQVRLPFCLLRSPRRNDTPVTMYTSSNQILVPKTIFKKKEPEIFGEIINSRNWTVNIQHETEPM